MEKNWYYIVYESKGRILEATREEIEKLPFSSRSCASSKEELISNCKILEHPCVECGSPVSTNYCEPTKSDLIKNNICFHCDFWRGKLEENERRFVIDGCVYWRADDSTPNNKTFEGFGGRQFKIKRLNSDEVIVTRNLWYNGKLPQHFRERLKDNAIFIH